MKLNPFSRAKKTTPSSKEIKETRNKESSDTKSQEDKRTDGNKLAIKDLSNAVPEYETIKSTADIDRSFFSEDKAKDKNLKTSAKKILKKINFDGKLPAKTAIEAKISRAGTDPDAGSEKMIVTMGGELAIDRFFKKGLMTKLFGWIPRLFGGANKSLGHKWLKGNHGFNLYDPKKEHSHLEDPKRVESMLKSSRYAVSVVYKTDASGKFTKEPEAIVLVDRMIKATDQIKENLKKAPKAAQAAYGDTVKQFDDEKLNTFCMINTILVNPKSEAKYETGDRALFYRETLMSALLESYEEHTNFIIPGEVFALKDAKTKKYQYDQIDNLHFFDMDTKSDTINDFGMPATLVRNTKLYPDEIPAKDLADLMSMAMVTEHTKDTAHFKKPFMDKLNGMIGRAFKNNQKAFEDLNARLAA